MRCHNQVPVQGFLPMRLFRALTMLGLAACLACAPHKVPPSGRWQGTFESRDAMILVRLEIDTKGVVYLSAPDALDIQTVSPEDRQVLRQKLRDGLAVNWATVKPREMSFDGSIFRKPGGVAPQLAWDATTGRMTAYVYLGLRPAITIPLRAVANFDSD
jgi:hypothetical protein